MWGAAQQTLHHNRYSVRRQLLTICCKLRYLLAVQMSPNSSISVNLQIHPDPLFPSLVSILTHAGPSKPVCLEFKWNFEKHQGYYLFSDAQSCLEILLFEHHESCL